MAGRDLAVRLALDQHAHYVVTLGVLHPSRGPAFVSSLFPCAPRIAVNKWGSHVAKALVRVASDVQCADLRRALAHVPRDHEHAKFALTKLDSRAA